MSNFEHGIQSYIDIPVKELSTDAILEEELQQQLFRLRGGVWRNGLRRVVHCDTVYSIAIKSRHDFLQVEVKGCR